MTGFVLFGSILVVLLVTIIWAAIRAGDDTGASLGSAERRDAAIEALRDLELEYHTGKLREEEYRLLRARLERAAIDARDAVASGRKGREQRPAGDRGDAPPAPSRCPDCEESLAGTEAFCPACGAVVATPV